MMNLKLDLVNFANEDVIATSGYACETKYHLMVEDFNVESGLNEKCILLKDEGEYNLSDSAITTEPTELTSAPGSMIDGFYFVDLGSPEKYDLFYWNGSAWTECPCVDKHPR